MHWDIRTCIVCTNLQSLSMMVIVTRFGSSSVRVLVAMRFERVTVNDLESSWRLSSMVCTVKHPLGTLTRFIVVGT